MFISGFHGTNLTAAQEIYDQKKFKLSTKDTEWLGDGVYFYFNIDDAVKWRNSDAIVYAIIDVSPSSFLDLETDGGKQIFKDVQNYLKDKYKVEPNPFKTAEERQCAILRMIWDNNEEIDVIASSFATEKTEFGALNDVRDRRREFCVRNNSPIKYIHYIGKERLI